MKRHIIIFFDLDQIGRAESAVIESDRKVVILKQV
jgi:hypothetical protein